MSDSENHKSRHAALVKAIGKMGSIGRFSLKAGISPRTVHTWLYREKGVPDRSVVFVPTIAHLTGVPRRELAPHVYGKEPGAVA